MVIDSGGKWLGFLWVKVTLYFHRREKITKRLYHRLSDAILVNTLTDVREFKNIIVNYDIYSFYTKNVIIMSPIL